MRTTITCRHCQLDPDLKSYVEEKVSHLEHYFDRADEAHVVFESEGHRKIAGVTVHASRAIISSEQEADDMRSAFDRTLEKVERQIRRYKGRVRNHKGIEPTAEVAAQAGGVALESLGIVPESLASKAMTPAEASAELEEIGVSFLVFVNLDTDRVSVIYRRGDGDYGLVEPAE
jgi:putative sigma-54 modulation protein